MRNTIGPPLELCLRVFVGVPPLGGRRRPSRLKAELQRRPEGKKLQHAFNGRDTVIDPDRPMYRWRQMTPEQRQEALRYRQRHRRPWHGPPHYSSESQVYMFTAACYEHRPIIGACAERLAAFEADLLATVAVDSPHIWAWVVLPNHYHFLATVPNLKELMTSLGRLHCRSSYQWNGEDGRRGRHVWYRAAETAIKSERAFLGSLELCPAQRRSPRLRRAMAGLAVFKRGGVPERGRVRASASEVERIPTARLRQ